MSAGGAGVLKLVTGSVAGGGALVLTAAAAMGEVPMPEAHTVVDILFLSVGAYIWTQIRALSKQAEEKSAMPPTDSDSTGHKAGVGEFVMKQLERIAFGVDKTSDQLTAHRMEFSEFRGNVEARLDNLETKP